MYLLPYYKIYKIILLKKPPLKTVLIWFQAFFFFGWSLKQLSFGFQITENSLTSSINNSTPRLLSVSQVDDWIVDMLWRRFSDFFFLPAVVESNCLT